MAANIKEFLTNGGIENILTIIDSDVLVARVIAKWFSKGVTKVG